MNMSEKDYFKKSISLLNEYISFTGETKCKSSNKLPMNSFLVFFDGKDDKFNNKSSSLLQRKIKENKKNVFQIYKNTGNDFKWAVSKTVFIH
jgi:hypothetical protein